MVQRLTVVQILPALESGGVERGTLEVARELAVRGHRSIVISGGGRQVSRLLAAGSEHVTWPVGRKSLFTARWIPRLRRFLKRNEVDIVHARSRMPAWVAWLAWRGMPAAERPRFITTIHGLYSVGRYSRVMTRGERIIAVSRTAAQYAMENYDVKPEDIEIICRGVDAQFFPYGYRPPDNWLQQWYRQQPALLERLVLTLPGRLTRLKNHETFIDLISSLAQRGLPAHGLIVGAEDPRRKAYAQSLRDKVAALDLNDRISFLDHSDEIRNIYAVSNVVLSLSSRPESFGRSILEALSLGVPVAGYDHGGVGEILEQVYPDGRIPLNDTDALADRVAEILKDPPGVPATHGFSLREMLDRTIGLYEELALESDKGRAP